MPDVTSAIFRWVGLDAPPDASTALSISASQARQFRNFRVFFGLVWLYDAWTASSGATKHAIAQFLGLPFASTAVHLTGTAVMFFALYIALALLFGRGMRAALWVGIGYLTVMWIAVERGGDFNPATGGTDAGIAPPYLIALLLAYLTWRISQPRPPEANAAGNNSYHLWIYVARLMFGFLWAWDTLFKFHPYFITHFVSFLSGAEAGQPAWIVGWLKLWIVLITHTSPILVGIVSAIAEALIAWSLLSGKLMRIFLPFGLVYSLMIWSTAEGFGGPYGNGVSGMPGNMFGNAVIYALIFGYFMVLYRQPLRNTRTKEGQDSVDEQLLSQ
ncbi:MULTISPECIES: hypothetical protein [Acidobacterium]|uniref:Putative membrane protein n=1 Tax=Acidobacterium capsulatum (strain ATCC 51196 / DSM 11244 / BCRC 80197 / JCM 7670 / NBRC 15755 / NCIMB 13165 / 161) TaxID=240015 RepID=C1F4U2_ACIC5|nr:MULTISPECIES: hypothetical protein [Acidobacterium]ACO33831.1 putative membrane protein [Acidobacterium capsulatum ATCC 51196]